MTKLGNCCNCEKDLFCVDELNLPDNIRGGCSIINSNDTYYVIGEYGSTVFDMEQGVIKNKELIKKINTKKKLMVCDDCIQNMLLNGDLEQLEEFIDTDVKYFNDSSKFRGEELYSLWKTCFEFLLPRLKKFRDWVGDYPFELGSNKKWKEVLTEMIWFVETSLENNNDAPKGEEERYKKAEKLFFKYFFHLWG